MKIRNKKLLTKSIAMAIFMSSTLYTMPITQASTALNNNFLPQKPNIINGQVEIKTPDNNTMNITQTGQNAVIKWNDFSIGANATVNFNEKDGKSFNTLNYVNGGNLSQIYGTINATNGNIYIVNPAGVQIGNSAQINVGSLYVSNKNLDENKLSEFKGNNFNSLIDTSKTSNAELMSLGNINAANKVTFDGNRIVLDVDRVNHNNEQTATINIKTTDKNNVILGYDAYSNNKFDNSNMDKKASINGNEENIKDIGYMWVEDLEQLQAINKNKENSNVVGNYALRNNIDASATKDDKFQSIGGNGTDFGGKFDGLDYNIFGLHADNGLFESAENATIRNFSMISGEIGGSGIDNVGAVVGTATNSTIENILNTSKVTGTSNVGGIVGSATDSTLSGLINTGAIEGSSNVGGLVGSLIGDKKQSSLAGESYNLGDIKGTANNVGGLVGSASNSIIGNETGFQIYNHLDVEGGYNVGGIVGNLENGSTVQNVSNDGNVKATDYTNGSYIYHTNNATEANDSTVNLNNAGEAKKDVHISNVGGIVGNSNGDTINDSTKTTNIIKDVLNNGDVSTELKNGKDTNNNNIKYYIAGNVGGVIGSAVNTDISSATNKESNIRGAHNVGGVVGYFEDGTIANVINNGGDIMATGARNDNGFVTEHIRPGSSISSDETFIVGNIGGIVGYMYGDNAYVNTSANRGTVHTEDIADENNVLDTSKAANVGGIVGKIDRSKTKDIGTIKGDNSLAAINSSYNTGNVRGYTGVGGVAGMMYNGEIANSYNIGEIKSTRKDVGQLEPLNMGGIVGDSTEQTSAKISLYDVYNKGQIGDENFVYKGRHVGGIAGRLSGDVEKSYNDGDIYNGANVTGGIAGWWTKGDIKNSFNTGNVTNYATTMSTSGSNVGGIVGGMGIYHAIDHLTLENVYNLGTIRSINGGGNSVSTVGGIIGVIGGQNAQGRVNIKNVYTLGNLYADSDNVHSIIGSKYNAGKINIENAYYITPESSVFKDLSDDENNNELGHTTTVKYDDKDDLTKYDGFNTSDWRIYDGTTPILNAFMPESSKYLEDNKSSWSSLNISSVQYGTAYDPLLTIINTTGNITMDWDKLGIYGDAGLAVYSDKNGNGGGLTLNNFVNSNKGVGLFGGIIYSDGALNINSAGDNIGLGSFSKVYGSSINIDAGAGTVDAYGSIISTGNNNTKGDITITGANVNTYGEIKTAVKGQTTTIDGIKGSINDAYDDNIGNSLTDQNAEMPNIAEGYAHTVTAGADSTGDVSITATNGDVNIYYGNMEKGIIDTQGDVSLSGNNVYVDSDMVIGGDLTTTADSTGEIVVDISNIGKVSLGQYTDNLYKALVDKAGSLTDIGSIKNIIRELDTNQELKEDELNTFVTYLYEKYIDKNKNTLNNDATESAISDAIIKGRMHNFLKSFEKPATGTEDDKYINFAGTDNAKITIDMWDYNNNTFDLDKYDLDSDNTLSSKLDNLNVTGINDKKGKDFVYIWVADGEQLKGIQKYATNNSSSSILSYNFVLKNDINATDVDKYQSIGGNGTAFTGKFDGRGNRIIGLNTDSSGNSIFGTIGADGKVSNLKVYSSNFQNGAIASENNGTIDNVTGLGNTITGEGNVGGFVGTNNGIIQNSNDRSTVISQGSAIAGGLVGTNTDKGTIENSITESAVTSEGASGASMGGIAGTNNGTIKNVDSLGVTSGLYIKTDGTIVSTSDNVGGIVGTNTGTINSAYNESIVTGQDNVGGIAGTNTNTIEDVSNANSVTSDTNSTTESSEYVGGLVGSNTGSITNGRNNGTITGQDYVGGMVGYNGKDSSLSNLVNDDAANITGEQYVGGIAGTNSGSISTTDTNLINHGSITGNKYVGGIAGENKGTIANVNNDIVLNATGTDAQYFGGVTGINTEQGTIKNATNRGNINASGATYVGGIAGVNNGKLDDFNGNYGDVTGENKVGGAVGQNNVGIDDVKLVNTGEVTSNGGAGGIFGENTANANITNSDLSNSGTVTGGGNDKDSGTGGLIGINSGDIEKTSLRNEVNGNVSGVYNVGGLIGINSGTITGGRDDANTYYKYQIYNNGTITAKNSSNIGGLIGINSGNLTAGYNTGNIVADGSNNVGGIVGTNEGTVDQVFNTIAGNGSVKGNVNVGGLIGTNSGKLSNAYSTSIVVGKTNVGNVVGDNTNGTVTNIYATNTNGNLIGTNNGTINTSYSFSSSDDGKKGITYLEKEDEQKDKDKYTFDRGIWKFYDGNANPLLKIFLTKAEFVPAKDKDGNNVKPNFVYNGKQQGVLISYNKDKNLVEVLDAENTVIGTIKVADENAAHSLKDYINTIGKDNQLINGVQFVDAGTYEMLFSQQINTDGEKGNPNNLGFDFVTSLDNTNPNDNPPTITNDKAKLTITANDVYRIYGNTIIQNGDYGISIDGWVNGEDYSKYIDIGHNTIEDSALTGNTTGKVTNNVGNYNWTGTIAIIGSSEGLKNYEIVNTDVKGKSIVNKADLTIDLNDVNHKYGTPNLNNYGINSVIGLTNGDKANIGVIMTKDNALKDNNTHTNDVGNYTWTGSVSGIEGLGNNYIIKVNEGQSVVKKAKLDIIIDNTTIEKGEHPNYNGQFGNDSGTNNFTNGDTPDTVFGSNWDWGITNPSLENETGTHGDAITIIINGNQYITSKEDIDKILPNYDVNISFGDLTVKDNGSSVPITPIEPIKPVVPGIWSHIYQDQWDRNRDFKERKAEFNFVDGAIPLDEAVEEV